MRQALFTRIESKTEDLIDLARALICIPTINPPGDAYVPCAELLGGRLQKRGFDVRYLRAEGAVGDSDNYPRTNVIARFEGKKPGPCVHFNSHIDVVPVGKNWTVDPFTGIIDQGRLYGRGSCDMKGGLAASVIAVEALLEEGQVMAYKSC